MCTHLAENIVIKYCVCKKLFFSPPQQTNAGQDHLALEVYRSHAMTVGRTLLDEGLARRSDL
jgi:hypothetical protein